MLVIKLGEGLPAADGHILVFNESTHPIVLSMCVAMHYLRSGTWCYMSTCPAGRTLHTQQLSTDA